MVRPARVLRRVTALGISLVVRSVDLFKDWVRQCLGQPLPPVAVVLYYHAIKRRQRARFARQMDQLLKYARPFSAGSPDALTANGRFFAVTFDDGFRSVVENAVPELARRNIPFTIFVPSGCLGERPSWIHDPKHPSWEERVLSPPDLRALGGDPLATVGSHSVTHRNLLDLDSGHAAQELGRSREDLRTAAATSIDLFSFPHGGCCPELIDQARQAGYRRVFTIEPGTVNGDPGAFVLGRVAVDPEDWLVEFRLKAAGAYRWRRSLHRVRQFLSL